eukprot:TRINITY_DN3174_c0_g3_i2.p1 TRINITY_DN3174_c0_g3~~TRINITY_DN3174_c0_g3_i2.p1  ORF type:complete len:193 (-),score=-17.12 TRINITY_DN3174_c0_g3_i2:656-1234(-)
MEKSYLSIILFLCQCYGSWSVCPRLVRQGSLHRKVCLSPTHFVKGSVYQNCRKKISYLEWRFALSPFCFDYYTIFYFYDLIILAFKQISQCQQILLQIKYVYINALLNNYGIQFDVVLYIRGTDLWMNQAVNKVTFDNESFNEQTIEEQTFDKTTHLQCFLLVIMCSVNKFFGQVIVQFSFDHVIILCQMQQ